MADKCTRWWFNNKKERVNQRRKEEAKSFSWFFSQREIFFPVENFHFGRPKTSFSGFWKVKRKRKKKNHFPPFISFSNFPFSLSIFPFMIFLLFFSNPFPFFSFLSSISRSIFTSSLVYDIPSFLLHFPPFSLFFLACFFPVGQQKFPGQNFLGGTCIKHMPPNLPLISRKNFSSSDTFKKKLTFSNDTFVGVKITTCLFMHIGKSN